MRRFGDVPACLTEKVPHIGLLLLGLFWLITFSACTSREAEARAERPVVTINELQLTADDLKQELQGRGASFNESAGASGVEPEWLNQLILRELLVQEAQRLGLDRKREFMATIERFWKEALIKVLLSRKESEITASIHVYEPEIESHHQKLTAESKEVPVEPLPVLREEIIRTIRQDKETKALEQWLDDLRKRARVVVDERALAELE